MEFGGSIRSDGSTVDLPTDVSIDLHIDAIAQRYGVLPTVVSESDVENIRVFDIAKKVENKIAEKHGK